MAPIGQGLAALIEDVVTGVQAVTSLLECSRDGCMRAMHQSWAILTLEISFQAMLESVVSAEHQ